MLINEWQQQRTLLWSLEIARILLNAVQPFMASLPVCARCREVRLSRKSKLTQYRDTILRHRHLGPREVSEAGKQ